MFHHSACSTSLHCVEYKLFSAMQLRSPQHRDPCSTTALSFRHFKVTHVDFFRSRLVFKKWFKWYLCFQITSLESDPLWEREGNLEVNSTALTATCRDVARYVNNVDSYILKFSMIACLISQWCCCPVSRFYFSTLVRSCPRLALPSHDSTRPIPH